MSEAETPNNQPLPEPAASMEDSAVVLPEGSGTQEPAQIVKLSDLRNFRNFVQPPEQEQPAESDVRAVVTSTVEVDEHADETPDASLRRTNDADWFALAQKMRQRNHRLHEQVTQLRQALKEKQEALHLEVMRSRDQEAIIAQQVEDMNAVQEQLARLFHALESSHQAAQRQQILIETLSEQLQSSQERVAQLERECAFTQQRYNEQSHQLLQAANTCRELRTRLYRQQQQALQFKVALEKSLEMTASSNAGGQQQPQVKGNTTISYIHKAQPIPPWSADRDLPQDKANVEPLWNRPIAIEPPSVEPFVVTKLWEESSENAGVPSELPTLSLLKRLEETNHPAPTEVSEPTPIQSETFPEQETDALEQEWEEQLLAEMSSLAEASGLSEVQSDSTEAQASFIPESDSNLEESDEPEFFPIDTQDVWSLEDSEELDAETPTQDEDDWESYATDEPEPQNEVVLPQSNWPSPTLYPLRTPKKRKSLAAIDLPSFPRFEPS
jgi:hypothetical protein